VSDGFLDCTLATRADAAALGRRRVHEFSDGGEHGGDGLVVRGELFLDAGFELIEAFGKF
jgi:hypothetical protein